ncbi:efflux RND transporter periplasmic adaptor subunit [Burkholderiaceae bacterium DAT-1]|nr:efflux RND transporter periplasmic adaptor subunit [Burkholderiaceae bacterium DAT-1]
MKMPSISRRTWMLLAGVVPLLGVFAFVVLRSGPLAPIAVTVAEVRQSSITPGLFGVGTVQARQTHRVGPTVPGRVKWLNVQVGDTVQAGQQIGEMDAVDLADRAQALDAAILAADAAEQQAEARLAFATTQAERYEKLLAMKGASEEMVAARRQDLDVARAGLSAARQEARRVRADRKALGAQQGSLKLLAPVSGVVVSRDADPGTTVVAGQSVVDIVDPAGIWVDVRFDQHGAEGLQAGLPASIALRSQPDRAITGSLLRIEPRADAVTEEMMAKAVFAHTPAHLVLGELAEVTVTLTPLPAMPVMPQAAIRVWKGVTGVWVYTEGRIEFRQIVTGRHDLNGLVQVKQGLKAGEQVVVYSERAINGPHGVRVYARLPGVPS